MIARTLLAIGVLFSGGGLSAQTPDPYLQLVRMYRTDPEAAALSLSQLRSADITAGVRRCVLSAGGGEFGCRRTDLLAAAMLHGEVAEAMIGPLGYAARDQIRFGRELLDVATTIAANRQEHIAELRALASFAGRWYAMTARLLLAHGYFEVARQVVSEGRIAYPKSPDLFVVLGLLTEWRAGLGVDSGDLRGSIVRGELFDREFGGAAPGAAPYRGNAMRDLEIAAGDYRRAIAIDPGHAGARLRLAWVHLLAGDRRVWEDVSPEFTKGASHEDQLLAHLLRGTAAERERNAPSALAEYRAARSIVPDSQTACVAVSSAQALNGQLSEARATAVECLDTRTSATVVDSWTLFRMGLMDATTKQGLRDEARRK